MLNVIIIGTGNVSNHICKAIEKVKSLKLVQICGRKKDLPKNFNQSISYCNNLKEINKADFYIICVTDDAISKVSNELIVDTNSIVVHCSGSTNMDQLCKHKNHGVLYPMQTFSKSTKTNFKDVPIIIEGSSNSVLNKIKKLYKLNFYDLRCLVFKVFFNSFSLICGINNWIKSEVNFLKKLSLLIPI